MSEVPDSARGEESVPKTFVASEENGDTAVSRSEHIADKINECATTMKVEPCDLTWADFRAFGSVAWGENNLGIVRRDITRLGGYNALRDAYFPPVATAYAGVKKRAREHANLNRRLGHKANDDAFQFAQIEAFSERVFSGRVKPISAPPAPKRACNSSAPAFKRAVVVCLGDDHWGADLLASETGAQNFGRVEEARCVAKLVKETIEFNIEHRAETELHVVLLGDFIHGALHDLRDGAVMSEQQSRAIHLLIQFVAHVSAAYLKVTVHGITGNHGRDKSRHFKQATSGKWDSREMLIYSAVKMATKALTNVTWDLPLSAFCVFKIFGKKYFITHGDGVIKIGNPGQSINVAELEKQTNRLNVTLRDKDEYSVVIVGHVHQSARVLLNNGVTVIVNGAGTPVDSFAVSIGIFESVSSQQIFEVVPGFPVGAGYPIMLDDGVYKDASLDKIVQPWTQY